MSDSTSEKRSEAGKKGGEAVSQDREHMSEIGRKGGEESHSGGSSTSNRSSSSSEVNNEDENQGTSGGLGSNLTQEDRKKGGQH